MIGARSHCAACGWPLDGLRCSACGGDRVPLPLQDGGGHVARRDADEPGLEKAGDAFQARDWVKLVGLLVGVEQAAARPVARADGTGWVLLARGTAVFVTVDAVRGKLTLEAPVGRLPQTQRVPALRVALELGDAEGTLLAPCLRADALLLRWSGPLANLPPATLRWLLRDAVERAERFAEALALRFDARPPWPDEMRSPAWDVLGTPRALPTLAAPSRQRELAEPEGDDEHAPPPTPPKPAEPEPERRARPAAPDAESSRARIADAAPAARPLLDSLDDDLPPILAPSLVRPQPRPREPDSSPPAPRFASRVAMPEIDLGEAPATPPSSRVDPPNEASSAAAPPNVAADQLCELLRTAQTLASPLGLEHRVGAELLLVRAAVFRAIYRFADDVPDAVANLYRATIGLAGEALTPSTTPLRTPGLEATVVEPALLTMDRILVLRARMPKERPLVVAPMTSVEEARGFLARYRDEIERAPSDAALRHFLAAGALSEFLVRAKLPGSMEGRLREILGHAEQDGARPRSVDLLMTTLERIIGS